MLHNSFKTLLVEIETPERAKAIFNFLNHYRFFEITLTNSVRIDKMTFNICRLVYYMSRLHGNFNQDTLWRLILCALFSKCFNIINTSETLSKLKKVEIIRSVMDKANENIDRFFNVDILTADIITKFCNSLLIKSRYFNENKINSEKFIDDTNACMITTASEIFLDKLSHIELYRIIRANPTVDNSRYESWQIIQALDVDIQQNTVADRMAMKNL